MSISLSFLLIVTKFDFYGRERRKAWIDEQPQQGFNMIFRFSGFDFQIQR